MAMYELGKLPDGGWNLVVRRRCPKALSRATLGDSDAVEREKDGRCASFNWETSLQRGWQASLMHLPPDCHRTLSLRATDGGAITSFFGQLPPERLRQFYSDWAMLKGWRPAVRWQATDSAWYAKFASPEADGGVLEVRFGPDGRGGWNGLLMTPPPHGPR